jgi:hypothetical protein
MSLIRKELAEPVRSDLVSYSPLHISIQSRFSTLHLQRHLQHYIALSQSRKLLQ